LFRFDEEFDTPCPARLPFDEPGFFQSDDHLVNGWWAVLEVALHVGFCGWPTEYASISVDIGEILPLFGCEFSVHCRRHGFAIRSI